MSESSANASVSIRPEQEGAAEFDEYAATYEAALAEGLSVSGESSEYFARGRMNWLARRLDRYGERPARVMDFGCGRGTSAPLLRDILGAETVIGTDVSRGLLKLATAEFGSSRTQFSHVDDYEPVQEIDLAFCNGVFHHIRPHERAAATTYVFRALRPGGLFAFWENNAWNPGTRYVMSRIPFDRDAIPLSYLEATSLLRSVGFDVLGKWFLFYFPSPLRIFRRFEPLLERIPLGAQYCVLARKPRE